jgi:hypothetical protein
MAQSTEQAPTKGPAAAGPPDWDSIPAAIREQMNISREEFENLHRAMAEREKRAPAVGSPAPEFELKRLDGEGALTQETLRLSSLRGRPVALVFGSYT